MSDSGAGRPSLSWKAREILTASPSPALATDPENRVVACNERLCTLCGRRPDLLLGETFDAVLEPTDIFGNRLDPKAGGLHAMVSRFEAIQSFKLDVRIPDGRQRVGVSVVVVMAAEDDHHEVVYLLTEMRRRRRADQLIDQILAGVIGENAARYTGEDARGAAEIFRLTERQREVLIKLAEGLSAGEIAELLGISVFTIRTHIQNILRTLEVRNQLEAVAKALALRLI